MAPLPAGAANYEITIKAMKFGPAPPHLKVGDTITWKNAGFLRHTATARNGAFDVKLAPGAATKIALQKSGRIIVFCRYHPDMTLTLSVAK
jgi:plastocyanin